MELLKGWIFFSYMCKMAWKTAEGIILQHFSDKRASQLLSCCLAKKNPLSPKESVPRIRSFLPCHSAWANTVLLQQYINIQKGKNILPPPPPFFCLLLHFFATETKTERSLSMTVLPQWINARQQKSAKDSFVKGKRKWCTTVQGLSRSTPFRRLPKAVSLFCRLSLSAPLLFVRRDGEEEGEWQLATRVDGSRKEELCCRRLTVLSSLGR